VARYAARTSVPVSKSKRDIEDALERYGASSFASGWDAGAGQDYIGFTFGGLMIRFTVDRPEHEQDQRQRWRALLLVVKAKLEAIDSNISSFEKEFLAWVVLPDGRTVGAWATPQLAQLPSRGLPMLPAPTGTD